MASCELLATLRDAREDRPDACTRKAPRQHHEQRSASEERTDRECRIPQEADQGTPRE